MRSAIVLYRIAEGKTRDDLTAVYPRHRARVDEFLGAGKIVSMGTFSPPVADGVGSFGIFTTRDDAESFVADDPFRLEGLVGSYEIAEFSDVVER